MAHNIPLYTTANGINRLSMTLRERPRDARSHSTFRPLEENSWEFTVLAAAVNIGIEILETDQGRSMLQTLGSLVVEEWDRERDHDFGGNRNAMANYVQYFLSCIRADFPNIIVDYELGGPDSLASTKRIAGWDGNLSRYLPKFAVGIHFNHGRVADMARAADFMWRTNSGQRQSRPTSSALAAKMANRHKHFHFMFGVATAHELCHAFIAFLAQNPDHEETLTPPRVSHLNFGTQGGRRGRSAVGGESGRWFENALFGGSLEFYYDPRDDDGQVGIAHVIDRDSVAWKIDPQVINAMVQSPRTFRFPFRRVGNGMNSAQRAALRLRSLGSTQARPQAGSANMRFMQALPTRSMLMYNVSAAELRRVPFDPRPLRAVRVA